MYTKRTLEDKPLDTNKQNNRHINNSAFRQFLDMLKYKAKLLIKVSPKNTTQECFNCGSIVEKSLSDRVHKCNNCNLKIDRDYNSSLNILKLGITHLPKELGEVTPVEIINWSMKQEAPSERAE